MMLLVARLTLSGMGAENKLKRIEKRPRNPSFLG
jgi:hypothetical protein